MFRARETGEFEYAAAITGTGKVDFRTRLERESRAVQADIRQAKRCSMRSMTALSRRKMKSLDRAMLRLQLRQDFRADVAHLDVISCFRCTGRRGQLVH